LSLDPGVVPKTVARLVREIDPPTLLALHPASVSLYKRVILDRRGSWER
jgi:hypothetical protein